MFDLKIEIIIREVRYHYLRGEVEVFSLNKSD